MTLEYCEIYRSIKTHFFNQCCPLCYLLRCVNSLIHVTATVELLVTVYSTCINGEKSVYMYSKVTGYG